MEVPFHGSNLSAARKAFNIAMARSRITVELYFKEMKLHWTSMYFKRKGGSRFFAIHCGCVTHKLPKLCLSQSYITVLQPLTSLTERVFRTWKVRWDRGCRPGRGTKTASRAQRGPKERTLSRIPKSSRVSVRFLQSHYLLRALKYLKGVKNPFYQVPEVYVYHYFCDLKSSIILRQCSSSWYACNFLSFPCAFLATGLPLFSFLLILLTLENETIALKLYTC